MFNEKTSGQKIDKSVLKTETPQMQREERRKERDEETEEFVRDFGRKWTEAIEESKKEREEAKKHTILGMRIDSEGRLNIDSANMGETYSSEEVAREVLENAIESGIVEKDSFSITDRGREILKISQDRNVFLVLSPNARLFDIGDGRFVPERVSWSSENYFTISSTSGTGHEDDPQIYHEQGYQYNKKDGIAYQDYESSVESISGEVVSETDYPELPPRIIK